MACVEAAVDAPGVPPTMCEWLIPVGRQGARRSRPAGPRQGQTTTCRPENGPSTRTRPPLSRGAPGQRPLGLRRILVRRLRRRVDVLPPTKLLALDAWYRAEVGRSRRRPGNAQEWEQAFALLVGADLPWEGTYAAWRAGEAHLRGTQPDRASAARWLRGAWRRPLGSMPNRSWLDSAPPHAPRGSGFLDPVEPPGAAGTLGGLGLAPREREVLAHVVAGRTYAEIAADLVLSEKTVSAHISHMLRKTGAANRVELAALAARAKPSDYVRRRAPTLARVTLPLFLVAPDVVAGAAVGSRVVLDGPEGQHAATVRRIGAGEQVMLADGSRPAAHLRRARPRARRS